MALYGLQNPAELISIGSAGIDPERASLYHLCEQKEIGITVMKGYFGGRLFQEKTSPFGVAFTPKQCIHYALTRPGYRPSLWDTIPGNR